MKANELMIGDWVQIAEPCKYDGAIGRIKTLIDHKDEENAYFKVFLQNNTIHIGIEDICSEDIRPIPLTPEILEKNGFEVTRNMSSSRNKDVWSLRVSKNKVFHIIEHHNKKLFPYFWIEIGSNSDIKYVHQLQHALKLCGIKKEIEL